MAPSVRYKRRPETDLIFLLNNGVPTSWEQLIRPKFLQLLQRKLENIWMVIENTYIGVK